MTNSLPITVQTDRQTVSFIASVIPNDSLAELFFGMIAFMSAEVEELHYVGSRLAIALPFWRALRTLATQDDLEQQWTHPFPYRELDILGEHIARRMFLEQAQL
jgi:hypothetical protein